MNEQESQSLLDNSRTTKAIGVMMTLILVMASGAFLSAQWVFSDIQDGMDSVGDNASHIQDLDSRVSHLEGTMKRMTNNIEVIRGSTSNIETYIEVLRDREKRGNNQPNSSP